MEFHSPRSLDEAWRALEAPEARCLAGGQSLVAMMNLGLVSPARLVSLRRIEALRGIERKSDGGLRLGAMTTHAEIAALDVAAPGPKLLVEAAKVVAYPAVRSRGTLGGSIAHADPAADYPAALCAAGAQIELASPRGTRRVAAAEFFRGLFETALEPGEIVAAVHVPSGPQGSRAVYHKLSLMAGDFAVVSVAALLAKAPSVYVGGYATRPVTPQEAAQADPLSDQRASAAYRRRVLRELLRRLEAA